MAKNYEIECYGHNSIYLEEYLTDNYNNRKFNLYFSTPNEENMNEETGILLIISGFGANSNSNVYKKMREKFADKYNLVTIQCDYFGWEFMQSDLQNMTIESYGSEYKVVMNEDIDNFNDMSIMQAIDNITATLKVMDILYSNNYKINTKKIMIMGQSQGAYLAYLCNTMCRNLYTHILDNSAWTYPKYLEDNRCLTVDSNLGQVYVQFEYLAKKIALEPSCLKLDSLYKGYKNSCKIVCYHGTNDFLIKHNEKYNIIKNIENLVYNEISQDKIDGEVFKNNDHGLGADFIKLFDIFYNEYYDNKVEEIINFQNAVVLDDICKIDYTTGLPIIYSL